MYTQFFGNFLLNNKYVSLEELKKAMEIQANTKLKLGVLAINAGYMTAQQVEKVHEMQQKVDKRFGDLAITMGFLSDDRVNELLSKQTPGYLALGQALLDLEVLSARKLETAISEYKKTFYVHDNNIFAENTQTDIDTINSFYKLGNEQYSSKYINLLFSNLIRFIGNDFIPLKPKLLENYTCKHVFVQTISGPVTVTTGIQTEEADTEKFASRFANETIENDTEYAESTINEFLNLQNGLYAVNLSNNDNIELNLQPQHVENDFSFNGKSAAMCLPFEFPFGKVNFIFQQNN